MTDESICFKMNKGVCLKISISISQDAKNFDQIEGEERRNEIIGVSYKK